MIEIIRKRKQEAEDRLQGLQDRHTRLQAELKKLENTILATSGAVEFANVLLKDAMADPLAPSQEEGSGQPMPENVTQIQDMRQPSKVRPPSGNSPIPRGNS